MGLKEQQLLVDQLNEDFTVIQIFTTAVERFLKKHPEFDDEFMTSAEKVQMIEGIFRLRVRGRQLLAVVEKFETTDDLLDMEKLKTNKRILN